MGGYGSGRRRSLDRRRQVESCLILDVNTIPRPIVAGNEGDIDLTRRLTRDRVRCSYLLRCDGQGFELVLWTPTAASWVASRIRLDHAPARLGGARPYLLCPSCRSRGLKLYWPLEGVGGLGCRRCHQLVYRSSQERPVCVAKLLAHASRPQKPFPSRVAAQRRIDRQRARVAATLAAAPRPAGPAFRQVRLDDPGHPTREHNGARTASHASGASPPPPCGRRRPSSARRRPRVAGHRLGPHPDPAMPFGPDGTSRPDRRVPSPRRFGASGTSDGDGRQPHLSFAALSRSFVTGRSSPPCGCRSIRAPRPSAPWSTSSGDSMTQ
jgi:hypothetical protein